MVRSCDQLRLVLNRLSEVLVAEVLDPLAMYAKSKGYVARSRIVLLEGTTDYDLFHLAAQLERKVGGNDLLCDLALIPAGDRDAGGTNGVVRELLCFRAFSRTTLLPNGKPRYRIVALLDNDKSGRQAIRSARQFDISIIECKDIFLLWPEMPPTDNRDPNSMRRMLEAANEPYKGLDWEPEDLLSSDFVNAFEQEHVSGIARKTVRQGKTHRDFTTDGKARFHHFIKTHAIHKDVVLVIQLLRAMRSYLGLP